MPWLCVSTIRLLDFIAYNRVSRTGFSIRDGSGGDIVIGMGQVLQRLLGVFYSKKLEVVLVGLENRYVHLLNKPHLKYLYTCLSYK